MALPLILLISLSASFRGLLGKSQPSDHIMEELGKAIYLRKINLLADFSENEETVFEKIPSNCFTEKELHYSGSNFDYYKNTKAFYSKMATGASLDASLQSTFTLGFTLSSSSSSESSSKMEVSGMSLNILALKKKIFVRKECLNNVEISKLTKNFLDEYEALPKLINKPWESNSWQAYKKFLDKFGSHIVLSVKRGASIKQTTFAQSSESYSQRDFQIKSCVSLAGPTSVGKVGVEACANISKTEKNRVSKMNTQGKLIVLGGTKNTRNALLNQRTKELIEKLMNEADESDAAVEHSFTSIWDVLRSRSKYGTDNYIRAVNLQNYYFGYLNYGCQESKSTALLSGGKRLYFRKFDYTKSSRPESPEFSCTLAKEGCHRSHDCHYRVGVYCGCYGDTCVRHKSEKQDTGVSKYTAHANREKSWRWHGCGWKKHLKWSKCECKNRDFDQRIAVWTLLSRDFVKGSHGSDQHKSDRYEERQEHVASGLQKSAEESMERAQIASQKAEFITSGNEDFFNYYH